MGTFLEFYQALVKFVNFKLFSDCGMQYPFKDLNPISQTSVYLDNDKVQQMQQHIGKLFSNAKDNQEAIEF
jgi:hypothetical protein